MKTTSYYVNNKELLAEIIKYRATFSVDENGKLITDTR